jgi:hypothetical protein
LTKLKLKRKNNFTLRKLVWEKLAANNERPIEIEIGKMERKIA